MKDRLAAHVWMLLVALLIKDLLGRGNSASWWWWISALLAKRSKSRSWLSGMRILAGARRARVHLACCSSASNCQATFARASMINLHWLNVLYVLPSEYSIGCRSLW